MKTLFLSSLVLLTACGSIPSTYTIQTKEAPSTTPATNTPSGTTTPATTTTDTTPTSILGTETTPTTHTSIECIENMNIPGMLNITSAGKVNGIFYFTGMTERYRDILGYFKENTDNIYTKEINDLFTQGYIPSYNKMLLVGATDQVLLADPATSIVYTVDPDTMQITDATNTECGSQVSHGGSFVKEGSLMRVYSDKILNCGKVWDVGIVSTDTITDPATNTDPTWLRTNHGADYGFNGTDLYQFDTIDKTLVLFDTITYAKVSKYSTVCYATGSSDAHVVMQDSTNLGFFGCGSGNTCTFAIVRLVTK